MYCNKRLCVSWSVRVIPPESISPHSPSYPRCCCMWRANLQLCSGLFGQWSLLRKCSRLVLKPQLQSLISVLKCSWSWWGIPDQTQRLPSPGKESLKERDILRDQHVLKIRWSWVHPHWFAANLNRLQVQDDSKVKIEQLENALDEYMYKSLLRTVGILCMSELCKTRQTQFLFIWRK